MTAPTDHVVDFTVPPTARCEAPAHPAKYAPGLASVLVELANSESIGDPMAGTGRIAAETGRACALNEIDRRYEAHLRAIPGCFVTIGDARKLSWKRDVLVTSPPYYPRTDRKKHPPDRRPAGGYKTGYACDAPGFIGNPGGVHALDIYRMAMRACYAHWFTRADRLILVVKNITRDGVELRLDLDTVQMAEAGGWVLAERHGWEPPLSHWQRFNLRRGTAVTVEDVLMFHKGD